MKLDIPTIEGINIPIPTFDQLAHIAPVGALVMLFLGVGFYVGWKVRGEVIKVLREWLEDRRK